MGYILLKKMPNYSIIIPHCNNIDIITRCLNSLIIKDSEFNEIIVVDDGSKDKSSELIIEKYPNIKVIKNSKNKGFAESCNIGALSAINEYLIFLNNDTEVTKGWTKPLIYSLLDGKISSVQPKIKNLKNKNLFDYAGAVGGYLDIFVYPFCRGRMFNTIEHDYHQYDSKKSIFWASGAAFATKKRIFIKSGMFDKSLYAHMEEIDYHWRSQMMGYKILSAPDSIVYHEGAMTLSKESFKKVYLNHRNSWIVFIANHKIFIVVALIIPKLILHLISTLLDFFCFRFRNFFAQMLSLLWVVLNIKYLIKKRINNKKIIKKGYTLDGMYNRSIVIDYFIFNRRFYSKY